MVRGKKLMTEVDASCCGQTDFHRGGEFENHNRHPVRFTQGEEATRMIFRLCLEGQSVTIFYSFSQCPR